MRTMCVLALVSSLLAAGCATTGTNNFGGGWANESCQSSCGSSCDSGCASGNCGTSANFSDYNYDCGPMCGAYVAENQTTSPMGCDNNCQVGNSMMSGYFADAAANMRGRMASMKGRLGSRGCATGMCGEACADGSCDEAMCADGSCGVGDKIRGMFASARCKGLGSTVGCSGCGDCGGSAIGLNNSQCTTGAAGGCSGKLGCKCHSCSIGKLVHPYGGQLPHTANAAATGMGGSGFGQGGSAPSYAYPYYTTRGPRDFLQDGCGPPPIYPSNPRPNCLPTIGG